MASWDDDKSIEEVAALAAAIAHPMRVEILRVLRVHGACSVAALRTALSRAPDTRGVMHHLQAMARAGVVDLRRNPWQVRLLRNVRLQTHAA